MAVAEAFHRRGHHIQGAHGRRIALADGEATHLDGAMIALMPTAADARRLAFPGGEKAADLHCTLLFLGDEGGAWTDEQRNTLEDRVRQVVAGLPPVHARVFGVAHWNGDGDKPSWVWSVGDQPSDNLADSTLSEARALAATALTMTPDLPEVPPQHSPWVAHICAAYSSDLTVVRALEKRLGPVTFDRIRLSFADDDRDIPLEGQAVSLTASAARRDPYEHEVFTDFSAHGKAWDEAVDLASARLAALVDGWREQIKGQVLAGVDTPEELEGLDIDTGTGEAADILSGIMHSLARKAGDALAREAQWQGVDVGDWKLPDDLTDEAVTAAVGGQRLLRAAAQVQAKVMAANLVQSARRLVTGLLGRSDSPEALADAVDERLQDAQDAAVRGPVGIAMSTAQTAGREAVLRAAPPGEYYASEILDRNTCGPCKEVDGEQFDSLEIAIKAYPVMGYKDCVGPRYGNACRGLIVARWSPEAAVTAAAGVDETSRKTPEGNIHVYHGTPGDPGYPLLHPKGGTKGKRKGPGGGMLGSDRYSEEEQMNALTGYIDDSEGVNSWLRNGEASPAVDMTDEEAEADALAMMDMIEIQEPLKFPKPVYRGMRLDVLDGLSKGDEFHDRGFVSTSEDIGVAKEFAGSDGIVVMINIPKGTRVLNVDAVGATDLERIEKENILQAGTRFKIKQVSKNSPFGIHYILEVVP